MASTVSTPRISPHFAQLRSTEPSELTSTPSMSKRIPRTCSFNLYSPVVSSSVELYHGIYQKREGMMTQTAKLFKNGRSQAVRLPAEFRFEGREVYIRRDQKT